MTDQIQTPYNFSYHTTKKCTNHIWKRSKDAGDRIYFVSDPERVTHALYPAVSAYFMSMHVYHRAFFPSRADTLMYFPRNRGGFEQVVLLVFVLTFSTLCRIKIMSFCSLKNGKII